MKSEQKKRFDELIDILENKKDKYLFECITDLIINGLTLTRFTNDEITPSRQDITQFLLLWFKFSDVPKEKIQDWLINYALEVLSVLSLSSKSQIKHSTKSNIKYIYNSENVVFDCGCENNIYKAKCSQTSCPLFHEMLEKYKKRTEKEKNMIFDVKHISIPSNDEIEQKLMSKKKKNKFQKQFNEALDFVNQQMEAGLKKKEIVKLLKENNYKTRTGKDWTYSLLCNEWRKYKMNKNN
jgi:hypothetical protein